jgi:hypothetical protein
LTKYAEASNKAIIDGEKSHIEGFPMVMHLLRKTTGFAKHPSDAMPQGTIIPLNTNPKPLTYISVSCENAVMKLCQSSVATRP